MLVVSLALAAVSTLYSLFLTVADRPVDNPMFWVLSFLELAMLIVAVWGVTALVAADGYTETGSFIGYLITVVIVPPAVLLWGIAEKSRWGAGVLLVGMFSMVVLIVRLNDLWPAA